MQVTVKKPDLEKFIADQLHCGLFELADAAAQLRKRMREM
jgi:hypothetical protein